MSEEIDLTQQKKEAAAKAKAAALARKQAKESGAEAAGEEQDIAKQKAAAAAKAKAAALARKQAKESGAEAAGEEHDIAKQKAAAAAKAKAAALARKQAKESGAEAAGEEQDIVKQKAAAVAKAKAAALAKKKGTTNKEEDPEKAKAIAVAKAKAAAAAKARNTVKESPEDASPEEPSPNQPILDQLIQAIERHLGEDTLVDYYINSLSKDIPTLVAKPATYFQIADFLRHDETLNFQYLSELHGTDYETHMEMYVHLYSFLTKHPVALKVKLDRDSPSIPSLVPLWPGANWPECEAYDLLGIQFQGHPDLKRILLGEEWVGFPLRKDYQPFDVEV
ncbi:NADH-quinone oxidoreductase subunit C [Peribacillus sp. NPDC097295]|uniref:NADH-quinone oxidoreductase subunit C n=1 Tax=Peribacillus sp. NPDC097295 TaxID=3364402 RepID=UPI00380D0428